MLTEQHHARLGACGLESLVAGPQLRARLHRRRGHQVDIDAGQPASPKLPLFGEVQDVAMPDRGELVQVGQPSAISWMISEWQPT